MTEEPPRPETGPTGSEITEYLVTWTQDAQTYTTLRPGKPERAVWDVDDWGNLVIARYLTDEELAAAIASWEKYVAEWDKRCGRFVVAGPTEITCECECADGYVCSGIWDGKDWRWMGYGPKPQTQKTPSAVKARGERKR